jgi:HlyD family secretion protein
MKTPRYARPIAWIVATFLVVGGLVFLLRPRPVTVEAATVARRHIETAVEAEAKTRVHDRFVVSAPVQGRLLRIAFEEGDRVTAGQHLASIDPLPYNASIETALNKLAELQAQQTGVETLRPKEETLAQARARVAASQSSASSASARVLAAQAAFEQADREAQRQTALERQGYASRLAGEQAQLLRTVRLRELQVARTDAAAANAQVAMDSALVEELTKKVRDPDYLRNVYGAQANAIRAQLRTLEDQASRTTITAPVSGEVLRVLQKSEAYVPAGAPLLEIGSRGTLEIVADVLSQDAVGIHVGDALVVVRGAGSDHPRGTVRRIEPSGFTKISALGIEEQRVNVIAVLPTRPASLGDAYRLDVRIVTWSGNALSIPVAALVRCGDDWCTFVIHGGKATRKMLRIGRMGDNDAEVLGGVELGDSVVLRPSEAIRDGASVRTVR